MFEGVTEEGELESVVEENLLGGGEKKLQVTFDGDECQPGIARARHTLEYVSQVPTKRYIERCNRLAQLQREVMTTNLGTHTNLEGHQHPTYNTAFHSNFVKV